MSDEKLVLEIEVAEFNVEGAQDAADEWYDGDVLPIVTEEWMRRDVALGLVSIPGEKCLNSDFEIYAMNGRIVGARIVRGAAATPEEEPEKPKGWPDKCHNCGAHWSHVGFDYALGFNCRKCGATDADE